MRGRQTTYSDSGVNVELGDDVSKIFYNAARETWKNRKGRLGEVIVPFDDFSGVRAIDVSNLPKGTLMNIGFDGIGTKVEIAERMNDHSTMAYDLFAMVCDDAVVRGAEPVLVGSIFDVNRLTAENLVQIRQLASGYLNAAREADVAVVNGEIAELGNRVNGYIAVREKKADVNSHPPEEDNDGKNRKTSVDGYGAFAYNWGAAVVWFAKKERLFTGYEIKEGDSIVALREEGFRSNGLSLLRKIMHDAHGENWHNAKYNETAIGTLALHPSRIYCKSVCDMFGGYAGKSKAELHGIVHVTGGGIPGKLSRALKPSGLGAELDDLFEPCRLMSYAQEKGNVSDEEAYRTWNMGNGMLLITPEPNKVILLAGQHGIEAKYCGRINKGGRISIRSMGQEKSGNVLLF